MNGDLNALNGALNALKGDLNALKGDLNALKADLNALKGDLLNALDGDLNALNGDLSTVALTPSIPLHPLSSAPSIPCLQSVEGPRKYRFTEYLLPGVWGGCPRPSLRSAVMKAVKVRA